MPDDKTKKHPQDGKRIDINDPSEVSYWSTSINCSPQELGKAVSIVGTSAAAVKKYLDK